MRTVTTQTQDAFNATWKGGTDRPMARATIQRMKVALKPYSLRLVNLLEPLGPAASLTGGGRGHLASMMFAQDDRPVELPNIKSIKWQRSVESEIATMTMVLWNQAPLPMGQVPDDDVDVFERPGFYTPTRGESADSSTLWGHATNPWQGLLAPDRLIRTYEGYGFDDGVPPEDDVHMYPSGVWLIDDVLFDTRGQITITARDVGRSLIDHIAFPPVVPFDQYPIWWSAYKQVKNPPTTTSVTKWFRPSYNTDSNIPYIGRGFTDGGYPYVDGNGGVRGHYGKHAFDGKKDTYWLSVGNWPDWRSDYEYVEGKFKARPVEAVKVHAWGGPYRMYISVYANGAWQGRSKIPYVARRVDSNADIKFVKSVTIKKNGILVVKLPKKYAGATRVRITMHASYNSGIGTFKYRAGVRDISVSGDVKVTDTDTGYHTEGNYGDYTDIVRWFLGWGGFHWPAPEYTYTKNGVSRTLPAKCYLTRSDGVKEFYTPTTPTLDASVFPNPPQFGTVWGDLEQTGTQGKIDLTIQEFDKKPLLDCITYVRDIVNFVFYIDETGGAIFRSPNIWDLGNQLYDADGRYSGRTATMHTLTDDDAIIDLASRLSSKNVREKVFVANVNGRYGAVSAGYNPYPAGLRRVAGWTDQNFETEEECQVMSDLITIRQMFRYRTNTVSIPGHPGIQIDDQVKLQERITSETYTHYVKSIGSDLDLETGKWTYALETFWLGESPFDRWAFDPNELSEDTRRYLQLLGKI